MNIPRLRDILLIRIYEVSNIYGFNFTSNDLEKLLGCDVEIVKKHLESQFGNEYSWDSYGKEWHIDHIKPIGSAISPEDMKTRLHYTNLAPLSRWDNILKGRHEHANVKKYPLWTIRRFK